MQSFCILILVFGFAFRGHAQELSPVKADTLKPGQNERPSKAKFIAETDQRFFYFRNLNTGSRAQTNVWGVRAGLLWPANVKIGVGYYFTNQQASGEWNGYLLRNRRLAYGTVYVEPYYFRRKYWEFSMPIEVGYGTARYELDQVRQGQELTQETHQTWAVPLGIGASFSVKFPPLRGFRPTRWLGINFMAGYRLTIQERVPSNPSTYNGSFYSISPAIFLDRIYEDIYHRRKRR
jgi:hypothetical protein